MDNLFGKDDSGNDSDHADVDIKDEQSASFEEKQSTSFEDKHFQRKDSGDRPDSDTSPSVVQTESDTASNRSSSDQDKTTTSSPEAAKERDSVIDIVKHELDIENTDVAEGTNAGSLFDGVTVLPHSTPMMVKDRRESKEKSKRELEEEEREKMQVLVSNFTEDQLDRYEMYRRAAFPKAAIKRIMQTITGCSVSQNVVIAMSGIAKVFVGEIVEEALDVMEANNETGPLQPKHLREAVRRLRLQGQIPTGRAHKAFFRL